METFVIRVWRQAEDVPDALRGSLEKVGSRDRRPFRSETELLGLLRETATDRLEPGDAPPGDAAPAGGARG